MPQALLIRGGRVIDPASRLDARVDILIENGDIVAVAADGTAWFPLPADHRLAGNETTSLCLPQAWDTVRVCGDALREAPRLIMLSTDGYANSFQSDRAFLQVGADLLPMIEQLERERADHLFISSHAPLSIRRHPPIKSGG